MAAAAAAHVVNRALAPACCRFLPALGRSRLIIMFALLIVRLS